MKDDLISRSALIAQIVNTPSKVIQDAPYEQVWFTRFAARNHEILNEIEAAPAVDAVEVVRCADCRYLKTCNRTIELIPRQAQIGYLRCVVHSCEYGERGADDATD